MYGWRFFSLGKYKKNFQIDRKSGHSSFHLVVLSVGGVTSSLSCVSVPASRGSYNPSTVPGNGFCVVCGALCVWNFGLTWETFKSGQFRFTIRSCQTARSFLLPSSHYQIGTAPLTSGVASAAVQEGHRSCFILGGGGQVIRGFSVISGKKTKKIGSFDQHDW